MATDMPGSAGVFTRASSGLVRQVGTRDVLFYGIQQIALAYIVFVVLVWGAYPGASMELATILITVAGVAMGVCYAMFAAMYPRSGGEYVFLSRTAFPALGFAVSFSFAFWQVFYIGATAGVFCIFALSPFVATLGVQTDNQALLSLGNWFGQEWGIFIAGSVMVVGLAYLQYRGARVYFAVQRWGSYLAIGSLLVTFFVLFLAAIGVLDFQQNFDELAGPGAYEQIVREGESVGAAPAPAFDLGETLQFMIWPAYSIWFAVASVSFSGEIKNVQRGQLRGITGAILSMGLSMTLLMLLYRAAFGSDFLLAASSPDVAFPLEAPPFVILFTAVAGGNIFLTVLMSFWVLGFAFFVSGTTLIYSTRAILAWSIDGVAPERLGDVSRKYRSPQWAILLCTVIGETFLALFAFTSLLGPIAGFLGLAVSFLVVSLWAIVFPFVRKEMFESSPIAWRVAGFPLISLLGIVASLIVVYAFIRLTIDSTFTVNLKFSNTGTLLGIAFSLIWFYGWKAYRRAQGVDLDRRYAEIPIE